MLYANFLGQFSLQLDDQPVTLASRPAQLVLAYLLLNPAASHRREQMAGVLWPESSDTNARHNLRNTVWQLRKALGDEYLLVTKDTVAFDRSAPHQSDVAMLQDVVPLDDVDALMGAVCGYQGDLLPGFYEDWIQLERERLRGLYERRMQALLDALSARGRWRDVLNWAELWLARGHSPEPAYRALMLAQAAQGDLASMAAAYRRCVQALKSELDVPPSPETQDLYARLSAGERPWLVAEPQGVAAPEPATAAPPNDVVGAAPRGRPESAAPGRPAPADGLPPVERYVREELLAVGGQGRLYKGLDRETGRPVVIKYLRPELVQRHPDMLARFQQEAQALRQLSHPNIVCILDVVQPPGEYGLVMDYVPGGSLRDLLDRGGRLPLDRALHIGLELADALSRAHHLGIIHRDVKPDNVLLAADGTPRLSDFGMSRMQSRSLRLTESGTFVGTPGYVSPETLRGQPMTALSDIWSFGVLLYELLAGAPPFEGENISVVLTAVLQDALPPIRQHQPGAPPALQSLLDRLLAKDPAKRLSSMRLAAAELEAIRAGLAARASQPAAVPETPPNQVFRPARSQRTTPVATPSVRFAEARRLAEEPGAPQQEIRFTTAADGVRLAYATVGQGPVLVKAANWLSHLEYDWITPIWRHWLLGLAVENTLVRYDQRGCGLSDWDAADFSLDTWVKDLEAVVEASGAKRFALLGISQGGPIAIAYTVRHPERVSHLVLYGTYVRGRDARPTTPEQRRQGEAMLDLIRLGWGQENPAFRHIFTSFFIPDGTPEQHQWFNDLQRETATPENAARIIQCFAPIDVRQEAQQLRVPTLVLHATGDERIPFEEGRLTASLIPGARFVPLDSRNHILMEDEPAWAKFLDVVNDFLRGRA
jgi:DNA-binding SARP family transcriptional activator/pimeloyl-ACP methyl ester carboxylesterase/tRNA A-37 threonylcarbamoyl transferase component Bud32